MTGGNLPVDSASVWKRAVLRTRFTRRDRVGTPVSLKRGLSHFGLEISDWYFWKSQ